LTKREQQDYTHAREKWQVPRQNDDRFYDNFDNCEPYNVSHDTHNSNNRYESKDDNHSENWYKPEESHSAEDRHQSDNSWNETFVDRQVEKAPELKSCPDMGYKTLHQARQHFHKDPINKHFPNIPKQSCSGKDCVNSELLDCCHHDLKDILTQSGKYSPAFLKRERLLWKPDKFAGKADGPLKATEMIKMIQQLIDRP
jgi:hypothetical protein